MRYPIDHGSVQVVQGDITDQDTEAIVNAANNHFWMGAGVAGAIKRGGGEAVVTSGGSLAAKYVIHAAVMGQDFHTDAAKIRRSTHSALALAENKGIASLSLPALGTGVGGFSIHHCASIMITEAVEFLVRSKRLREIRFVLFDTPAYAAFEAELKLQFSSKRHP